MDKNRSRINRNKQKHVRGSGCALTPSPRARAAAHGATFDGGCFWIVSWRFESSPELLGGGQRAAEGRLESELDGRGFG